MSNTAAGGRLIRSSIGLFIFQGLSLVLAFVRSAIFARYFGVSMEADAYTVALEIPTVLFSVVTMAIKTVLVPSYSRLLYNEGKARADRFFSNILNLCLIISFAAILLIVIFARQVVFLFTPGLNEETNRLAAHLLRFIAPSFALLAAIDVQIGVLNVHKRFALPQLSGELGLVIRIAALILFAGTKGIIAAAAGYLIGTMVSCALVSFQTGRVAQYSPAIDLGDKEIATVGKQMIPILLSAGTDEINKLVDKILASFLDQGSIAALGYASTLSKSASSLFVTCVSTIIYPVMTEFSAKKDYEGLSTVYVRALSLFLHITVPIFFGALILRTHIVQIVYARGAFDQNAVTLTAALFIFYFITILFSGLRQTSARLFYSFGDTATPMKNTVIGLGVNIVLNIILSRIMGAAGLALATALSTALITIMLLIAAKRRMPIIRFKKFWIACGKTLTGALLMSAAVLALERLLSGWNLPLRLLLCVAVGAAVYLAALLLLRSEELQWLLKSLLKKRRSQKGIRP